MRDSPRITVSVVYSISKWLLAASFEDSLENVKAGLELGRKTGIRLWDHLLLAQYAYITLTKGDLPLARRYLSEMSIEIENRRRLDFAHYHYLAAWEALWHKDLATAFRLMQASLPVSIEMGTPFPEALNRISMAQVLTEQGRLQDASAQLKEAYRIATRMQSKLLIFMALLNQAYVGFHRGSDDTALTLLRRALALGREQGYLCCPWWWGSMMASLCVKALEADIEVLYVQRLVTHHKLVPNTPPTELENWPWLLKIFTLGRIALVREGRSMQFSGKAKDRPIALLKAIISLGRPRRSGRSAHGRALA